VQANPGGPAGGTIPILWIEEMAKLAASPSPISRFDITSPNPLMLANSVDILEVRPTVRARIWIFVVVYHTYSGRVALKGILPVSEIYEHFQSMEQFICSRFRITRT